MRYGPAENLLRLARHLAATRTGLTLDEMAAQVEVGRRTAERMRDTLLAMFPEMDSWDDDARVPKERHRRCRGDLRSGEAAKRPTMRFVPVKTEAQQANGVVFRARDLLVHQRARCINALRGHFAEYGHVVPQGTTHVGTLMVWVDDPEFALPEDARAVLQVLIGTYTALEAQVKQLDAEINRRAKADPVARRLTTIAGVGPISATAIAALAPAAEGFATGRNFAARLGLTPLQKSSGGKQKLGTISKHGERTIRRLLIIGASAVLRQACFHGAPSGSWLAQMLQRKPRMLVTVALANKTARIVWALLMKGGVYKGPVPAA